MDIQKKINSLFDFSKLEQDFIAGGPKYKDVFSIAAGLLSAADGLSDICICTIDRSAIAASILCALAGGPGIVLPPSLSANAIAEACSASGAKSALADKGIDLPNGIKRIIPADSKEPLRAQPVSDRTILKLFTGGSTGSPKLWNKTTMNIIGEADYLAARYSITQSDCFASTVPPYHIYGLLFTVIIPMLAKASVLPGVYNFPREIISALTNDITTVFISVPVHYRALKDYSIGSSSLKSAFSSAGPLDCEDNLSFYNKTGVGVEEIYGSTETGGIAYRGRSRGESFFTPFEIIDWKTAENRLLIKSPFATTELEKNSEGYFFTSDRVNVHQNQIELLGRADSVVKVGGKRVDTDEVRDCIKSIEGVSDVYVVSNPSEKGRGSVISSLVETILSEDELRLRLSKRLDLHLIPKLIRIVDKIPVLSTGKYDRNAINVLLLNEKQYKQEKV